MRGGIASGDPNPDDGVRHNLNFDPNYNVGLAYFPEVKGNIEAATVAQLSDPNNAGQAPDGVESLATEGAFGSTVYIQPAVEVQPFDWIELRSGIMTAWASAPIAQPFYTFRAGGTPHNHLDEPTTGRYLATEFDWSIAVDIHDRWLVEPRIQVQGGHALLSSNLGGGRADLVTITARLGW